MFLEYLELKLKAVLMRLIVKANIRLQSLISGQRANWELAYPRRTREYSIPSSKTVGAKIVVSTTVNAVPKATHYSSFRFASGTLPRVM